MTARPDAFRPALDRAVAHSKEWLESLPDRPVAARASADELAAVVAKPLPDGPTDAAEVTTMWRPRSTRCDAHSIQLEGVQHDVR